MADKVAETSRSELGTNRRVHLHLTTLVSWNVSAEEDCRLQPKPTGGLVLQLSHLASGAQPKTGRRRHGSMTTMRDSGVGGVPKEAGHIALNLKHGIVWRRQGFVRHCTLKILGWSMACCAGPWTAKLEDCWAGRERLLDGEWPPYPAPGSGLTPTDVEGIGLRLCEGAESMIPKMGNLYARHSGLKHLESPTAHSRTA
jgi:hypothetical protein